MMRSDPIIEDVWRVKDAIAAACDYSPCKLAELVTDSALSCGVKTVDYPVRRKAPSDAPAFPRVAENSAAYETGKDS